MGLGGILPTKTLEFSISSYGEIVQLATGASHMQYFDKVTFLVFASTNMLKKEGNFELAQPHLLTSLTV